MDVEERSGKLVEDEVGGVVVEDRPLQNKQKKANLLVADRDGSCLSGAEQKDIE